MIEGVEGVAIHPKHRPKTATGEPPRSYTACEVDSGAARKQGVALLRLKTPAALLNATLAGLSLERKRDLLEFSTTGKKRRPTRLHRRLILFIPIGSSDRRSSLPTLGGGERILKVGPCPYMDDLYQIFRARLAAGVTSLHPHRWLTSTFNSGPPWTLDCRLERLSLFEPAAREGAPVMIIKNAAIWNTDQGRHALRTVGRLAVEGVYLAHPVLTDSYWTHQPVGVGIQDALKDLLAERIRGLRLEVRTPVGAADAATDTAVFEMARWETWKQAMGQLLAYALHLEHRRRILFLFGRQRRPAALDNIRWNARHYNVHVAYLRCDQTFGPQRICKWPVRQPAPVVHTCGPVRSVWFK